MRERKPASLPWSDSRQEHRGILKGGAGENYHKTGKDVQRRSIIAKGLKRKT
jgi:hypothetical protein